MPKAEGSGGRRMAIAPAGAMRQDQTDGEVVIQSMHGEETSPAPPPSARPFRSPILLLLPVAAAMEIAYFLPDLVTRARPGGTASVVLMFGAFASPLVLAPLVARFPVASIPGFDPARRRHLTWFMLAAMALFCVFAGRDIDLFPAAMESESAAATKGAYVFVGKDR